MNPNIKYKDPRLHGAIEQSEKVHPAADDVQLLPATGVTEESATSNPAPVQQ